MRARCDDHLVLVRELVHPEDGDDVLKVLQTLEDLLDRPGDLVVLLADDLRVEHPRGRVERVDGRVDPELRDLAREHGGRVEVREGGRRRGVGQVVGGHVDGLHRGDRSLARRADALLQLAHLGRERGLIADGAGHAAEQGRDLGARLREAEDVVDEEEHVLPFLVAEVLGHGHAREADAQTRSRRLVHLAVDQRGLVDDARLVHLEPEVVALAGALAHAGEDRVTAVLGGDVADQLHDDDRLADAGAAEEADLAALRVRLEEVDDLDPRLEDLGLRGLLGQCRRMTVDRQALLGMRNRAALVDRIAEDVDHAPEDLIAHRHGDRGAGVERLHPAHEAVGRAHGDTADDVVADVQGDLDHQVHVPLLIVDPDRVHDLRQTVGRELDVHRGTDHLQDLAVVRLVRHEIPLSYFNASEPPTSSEISFVIAA